MSIVPEPLTRVQKVAAEMKNRRLSDRNTFRRATGRNACPRGLGLSFGKDAGGKPVRLPANYAFKTKFLGNGLVSVEIGMDKSRMGKKILQWTGDKHALVTDIFSAVRIPVHIQARLVDARHGRDQILEEVERLNAFLNKKGHLLTPLGFNMRARLMREVKKELDDSVVPLKREALMMLERAEKSLLEAGVESNRIRKEEAGFDCVRAAYCIQGQAGQAPGQGSGGDTCIQQEQGSAYPGGEGYTH